MKHLLLLLSFFLFGKYHAQNADEYLKKRIDTTALGLMFRNGLVGLSLGIIADNKVFYLKGYGTRKLGTNLPVDSLSNFHMASISKLFVGTAIMKLASRGALSIENKLVDYFPGCRIKDSRIKEVTLKQMLTHTSGIPDLWNYQWRHPDLDSLALYRYSCKSMKKKL